MKKNKVAFAIMVVLNGLAITSYAQEKVSKEKTKELPTVIVIGGSESSSIDSTLENTDSIDRDNLNDTSVVDLESALNKETSIGVKTDGNGNATSFSIRGLGENYTDVKIDGVKTPQWFTYGHGWYNSGEMSNFEIETIKKIDIVKGRNSPKQSGGSLAGSVNMRTYRPNDFVSKEDPYYASIKAGYTSKNNGFFSTLTGAASGGDAAAMITYTHRDFHDIENQGNDKDKTRHSKTDYKQDNLLIKGQMDVDKGTIILTGEHFNLDREMKNRYNKKPSLSEPAKRWRMGAEAEFDDILGLDSVSSRITYAKYENTNGFYSRSAGGQFKAGNFKQDSFALGFDGAKSMQAGSIKHNILFGAGYNRDKFDFKITPEKTKKTYRPNPINVSQTYFAYAKDNISFSNGVILAPGIRVEHKKYKSEIDDLYLANPATKFQGFIPEGDSTKFLPSLNLTVPINESTKLFASYARGSKSADEMNFSGYDHGFAVIIPNPDLKDESSDTYELGIKHQFKNNSSIKVNAFYNDYDDFIHSESMVNNYRGSGRNAVMPKNSNSAKTYGIEVNANLKINEKFDAYAGATWMRGYRYDEDNKESEMLNTAPLTAVVGVNYNHNDVWGAGVNVKMASKGIKKEALNTPKEQATYFQTPSYGVVNLNGWWKPAKGLKISGGVNNVFDAKYWSASDANGLTETYNYPAYRMSGTNNMDSHSEPGRNFGINAIYEF